MVSVGSTFLCTETNGRFAAEFLAEGEARTQPGKWLQIYIFLRRLRLFHEVSSLMGRGRCLPRLRKRPIPYPRIGG